MHRGGRLGVLPVPVAGRRGGPAGQDHRHFGPGRDRSRYNQQLLTVTSATTDPDPDNNRASATTVLATEADLTITKTVTPDPPVPGAPVSFTLTVQDNGPSTAVDAVVTDPLNPAVLAPSAASSAGTCALPSGVATCELGSLKPGATPVTITVSGTLDPSFSGALSNTATITSATADPDLANNAATVTAPAARAADLTMTKTASPASVAPGAPVTFALKVTNRGPSDAHQVVITDVLVPQLVFSSASPGCAFGSATATIECEQGTVAAGETVTFTVTATVNAGTQSGPLVNQAVTATAGYDPDLANNGSSAMITVVQKRGPGRSQDGGQAHRFCRRRSHLHGYHLQRRAFGRHRGAGYRRLARRPSARQRHAVHWYLRHRRRDLGHRRSPVRRGRHHDGARQSPGVSGGDHSCERGFGGPRGPA